MARIIAVHSFRGGTGKSNLTANLASLAALEGLRVAVVDTDIGSPGIHVLFGLADGQVGLTLLDYLWGSCAIQDVAYAVDLDDDGHRIFVVPASLKTGEIARVLRDGYDVQRLHDGFRDLIRELALDCLFLDTHPGLNEETLLGIAVSDSLLIILRPDQQDYLGTAVTVQVARRLTVPMMHVLVNKAPCTLNFEAVQRKVSETYGCPVIGVLPHSDRMMSLGSAGVFALTDPDDPLTATLRRISRRLTME